MPGDENNAAGQSYTFAAGRRAKPDERAPERPTTEVEENTTCTLVARIDYAESASQGGLSKSVAVALV